MAGWPGGRWLVSDEPKPVPIQVGWVTVVPVCGQCRWPVPVAGGRWPVAGGLWPVAGGRWPVAGGRVAGWPVAGGRWWWPPVAGGRWPGRKNDYSEPKSPRHLKQAGPELPRDQSYYFSSSCLARSYWSSRLRPEPERNRRHQRPGSATATSKETWLNSEQPGPTYESTSHSLQTGLKVAQVKACQRLSMRLWTHHQQPN